MPEGGRVQLFVNPTNDTAVVPDVAGHDRSTRPDRRSKRPASRSSTR